MHEEYYGFVEKPFSLTPDPKYLYKSESHANAFDLLQYAIRRREGFVVVTGDIGTGKTTLCRAVLEQLDRRTFTALVLNPFLSEDDLLRLILQDFGVVSREEMRRGRLAGVSKQELINTLNEFLLSLLPLRAGALLIIDEAQNLPRQVLEQIRILSNLETDKEKLLQIVLVGQPNLRDLLKTPELRQLDQRISIRYELKPLNREETAAYVAHRLTIAGGGAAVSFAPKALELVYRYTGGIPRLINVLCDRALLGGFSSRTNRITPPIVVSAATKLELEKPRYRGLAWLPRRTVAFTAGVAAMAVVAALSAYSVSRLQAQPPVEATATAAPAVTGTALLPVAASPVESPQSGSGGEPQPVPSVGDPRQPIVTPQATTGTRAVTSPAGPAPPADEAKYSVQVHSFRLESEAAKLAELLRSLGYRVRTSYVDDTLGFWHRVFLGPYSDLEQAKQDEARVRQMPGYADARLVTH
jgi:general secretion pathway protein A